MNKQTGTQQDPAASAGAGVGTMQDSAETGAKNTEVILNISNNKANCGD